MKGVQPDLPRILAVDDEQDILDAYRQILCPEHNLRKSERQELATKLFGQRSATPSTTKFDLVPCRQGNDAVETVKKAVEDNKPFGVAFIDVRLPPGQDGLWTAEHIRKLDPFVEIVIVTAYSDVDPSEISARVLPEDKLLYVQKPFRPQEIRQFASALCAKWTAERCLRKAHAELEERIKERTGELKNSNEQLQVEIEGHKKTVDALRRREAELEVKSRHLEEANTALKVLLRQRDDHKAEIEERVLSNLKELVMPSIETLKASGLNETQTNNIKILESNLKDLVSPFSQKLSSEYLGLTPKEVQVANFVKEGKTTREIAEILNVSPNAIVFHRYNIRNKLGLKNSKVNLRSYLCSLR